MADNHHHKSVKGELTSMAVEHGVKHYTKKRKEKMSNKYLEKVAATLKDIQKAREKKAELTKLAWDGDYGAEPGDTEYGLCANRANRRSDVHSMLLEAAKDKDIHVQVSMHPGEYIDSWKHTPEQFEKYMDNVKKDLDTENSWNRDHVWSIGMKKDNPILQKYKVDNDGLPFDADGPDDGSSRIFHHLWHVKKLG